MQKVAFLDRDGTINIDYGYVHTKDKLEFIKGAIEGLKIIQDMGFALIIVSNQSGIGRGLYSEEDYSKFQNYFEDVLTKYGVNISATYYCPHVSSDRCNCRKPQIGLFERANSDFEVDWERSIAIGDRYRDLSICSIKNTRGFFIRGTEEERVMNNIVSVNSLLDVAKLLEQEIIK